MKLLRLKGVHIVAIGCVLVVTAGAVLQIYVQDHGGYSVDPTDPSNFYHALIKNNLGHGVKVSWVNDCGGNDPRCDKSWSIASGDTITDQAPRGYQNRYRILSQSNTLLGCLQISTAQSQTHGDITLLTADYWPCAP